MIIRPATTDDADAIASLWNARAQVAESCWAGAREADSSFILTLMDNCTFYVAEDDGTTGFGFWRGGNLIAFLAPDAETYYRLMDAYLDDMLANSLTDCTASISSRATDEFGWLTDLEVAVLTPIGFTPIAPGEPLDNRIPMQYAVSVDANVLKSAVAEML
jgi:hypothetical protein